MGIINMKKCLENKSCSKQKKCCGCCCPLQDGMVVVFLVYVLIFGLSLQMQFDTTRPFNGTRIVGLILNFIGVVCVRFVAMVYMYCKEGSDGSRWGLVYAQFITMPINVISYVIMAFMF